MQTKNKINLDPMIERFRARINHFGAQPNGVLWSNLELQIKRFQLLLTIVSESDRKGGLSIADFGCGYGALFTFIQDNPIMNNSIYTGYDITSEMIQTCRQKIKDERADFIHSDIIHQTADYVFVSGTFSLKCAVDNTEWEDFVKTSLLNLWQATGKGLAFNFLSDSKLQKDAELYYANADDYLAFCRKNMSTDIIKKVDPAMEEFTLLIHRADLTDHN